MPVYDYQCEKCGVSFENEHPMNFAGKVRCPACGSRRTAKVFHAAGVHFKGAGFYVTDSSHSRAAVNGGGNGSEPPKSETKDKERSAAGVPAKTSGDGKKNKKKK
jgi:putative FmdB family regulatory protein